MVNRTARAAWAIRDHPNQSWEDQRHHLFGDVGGTREILGMTYLSLSQWSRQFKPAVVRRIRRIITGRLAHGETLIVLDGFAEGLTPEVKSAIQEGWPSDKVRFSHEHYSARKPSRERRRRREL